MRFDEVDEDCFVFAPLQVLPEVYIDLDMQLLTAPDDRARWSALIAGTREVLDRFDHIAAPKVVCATGVLMLEEWRRCVLGFRNCGAFEFADWLHNVVEVLAAYERLQDQCAKQIRNAETDAEVITAIRDAADSLNTAAEQVSCKDFGEFPTYRPDRPDYPLMAYAGTCLGIEIRRNPLRTQLDGAGGAAGSSEFNPYVGALYRLERITHRRLYRLFYRFAEHAGMDFSDDPHCLFETPDSVDRSEF